MHAGARERRRRRPVGSPDLAYNQPFFGQPIGISSRRGRERRRHARPCRESGTNHV